MENFKLKYENYLSQLPEKTDAEKCIKRILLSAYERFKESAYEYYGDFVFYLPNDIFIGDSLKIILTEQFNNYENSQRDLLSNISENEE